MYQTIDMPKIFLIILRKYNATINIFQIKVNTIMSIQIYFKMT